MGYLGNKPANAPVTTEQIGDGAVGTSDLANGAVTPAKLSTGAPSWNSSSVLTVAGGITLGDYQNIGATNNNAGISLTGGSATNNGGQINLRGGSFSGNANGIEFLGGGTERMRIDTSGRVTTPFQPQILCKVHRASSSIGYYSLTAKESQNLSVGTYGGADAVIAPVAVVYAINLNSIVNQYNGRVDINIYKNGGTFLSSLTQDNVFGYQYRTIAAMVRLAAGDAIQVFLATAATPYYSNGNGGDLEWSNFSMVLLG